MHLPMNQIEIQHLRRCLNIHRISEAEKIIWNFTNKFFFVWLPIRFLMPFSCFQRSICIIEFQFEDKIPTLNFRPLVLRGQNFGGSAGGLCSANFGKNWYVTSIWVPKSMIPFSKHFSKNSFKKTSLICIFPQTWTCGPLQLYTLAHHLFTLMNPFNTT